MDSRTDTKPDTTPAQQFLEQSEWLPVRIVGLCLQSFDSSPDYYLGGQFEKEMFVNRDHVLIRLRVKIDELVTTLWQSQVAGAITADDFYRLSKSLELMRASVGAV